MKKALLVSVLLLGGCADVTTVMMTDYGAAKVCRHFGWGYAGVPQALQAQRDCVKEYARRGYRDMSRPQLAPAEVAREMDRQTEEALRPNERPKE